MTRRPDFDDLVGGEDLTPVERARLQRAHELLLAAGPPAELPETLVEPPEKRATVTLLPRRRRIALALVAAALAAAAFGGGYLVGDHGGGAQKEQFAIPMRGTGLAPRAAASLLVFKVDESGNWPMLMKIRGLSELPVGGYYELYLTRKGKIGPTCGTFRVHGGTTEVRLNAPYKLRHFDGWVVTRHVAGDRRSGTGPILLTT